MKIRLLFLLLIPMVYGPAASAVLPRWIQAQDARVSPLMMLASGLDLAEPEAVGEFLVPMVRQQGFQHRAHPQVWLSCAGAVLFMKPEQKSLLRPER